MKKKILTTLWVLWMVLIFYFSAQVAQDSQGLSNWVLDFLQGLFPFSIFQDSFVSLDGVYWEWASFLVRKAAHFSEYAILGMLSVLCAREYKLSRPFVVGFIWSACYACSDEFHQLFVAGRSAQIRDVLIDSSGALFGIFCLWGWLCFRKYRSEKREKELTK